MEREPQYDFGLSREQEERARRIHDESIVIDFLFQGPIGTRSIPGEIGGELEDICLKKHPGSAKDRIECARQLIEDWSLGGKLAQIYRDCWYESGITAGNRQLDISDTSGIISSMAQAQAEFDTHKWLIKALRASDIEHARQNNLKAGIVTCQETIGFGKDLSILDKMHKFGLRAVQLTYNNQDLVGSGCMESGSAGLSSFGRDFVAKLNGLGIVVDTGHCGRQTTLDACECSGAPVVASHTSAEKVFFHSRAKSDEEIRAIAKTGGVVGIFCMPWFIAGDHANTTIDHFLDHIDYVAGLAGIDAVGIGTDWPMPQTEWMAAAFKEHVAPTLGFAPGDGPSTEHVRGMMDYRSFGNITRGLVARGYSDGDVAKVIGGNWMRVFKEVWKQ
ncbi:MAG: dipeptidase [Clostridiales bacterium]|jgi:membrane dipeptidase|nr:dipeptidase [Clostridiales bacterium]